MYGFKLYLKCNKGYELDGVGESFIQCKEDGKWSEVNSKCSSMLKLLRDIGMIG